MRRNTKLVLVVLLLLGTAPPAATSIAHLPSAHPAALASVLMDHASLTAGSPNPSSSGGTWTDVRPWPSPRWWEAMAFSPPWNRLILFGGEGCNNACVLNETWAYDPTNGTWRDMAPAVHPAARYFTAMAYDPTVDRMILFGGHVPAGFPFSGGDTWAYDYRNNTWTDLNPVTAPPRQESQKMVYDPVLRHVVLYGGGEYAPGANETGGGDAFTPSSNETWIYNARTNTWSNVSKTVRPPPDTVFQIAEDPGSGQIVLYDAGQTWTFNPMTAAWTQRHPSVSPPNPYATAMAYDPVAGGVVQFAASSSWWSPSVNSTWLYNASTDAWTNLSIFRSGTMDGYFGMAYAPTGSELLLFGGWNSELWLWDRATATWVRRMPPGQPTPRMNPSMVYDSRWHRVVLFGGMFRATNATLEDPWTYDDSTWTYDVVNNTWSQMAPVIHPAGRASAGMAYDPRADRILLFGGGYNDTWSYDLANDSWDNRTTVVSPPRANGGGVVYDDIADRFLVPGGWNASYGLPRAFEMWTYDYVTNTWQEKPALGSPPTEDMQGLVYDTHAHRTLYFGITAGTVWSYDSHANAWSPTVPSDTALAGSDGALAYDPAWGVTFWFGGFGNQALSNALRVFAYPQDAWAELKAPAALTPRWLTAVVHAEDRLVIFGGSDGGMVSDLWTYAYAPTAPTAPLDLQVNPAVSSIAVSWAPPSDNGGLPLGYRIYRWTASEPEAIISENPRNKSFNDTAVVVGVTYHYYVSAVNVVGEGPPSATVAVQALTPPPPPVDNSWVAIPVVLVALGAATIVWWRWRRSRTQSP